MGGAVGVVLTITNSAEPVLGAGDAESGVHIVAVGSNNPSRQIDPALIARCKAIIVDDVHQALMGPGN